MNIDLKIDYKDLYSATPAPKTIDVPELPYLMIDGVGAPESEEFERAIKSLYGLAYGVRRVLGEAVHYSVMPMQGRWGADPQALNQPRGEWTWTLMILQPDAVTPEVVDVAAATLRKTKPQLPIDAVRLEKFTEGLCVQCLHVGPYAEEPTTISKLLSYAADQGLVPVGRHHEIYISDPNRTAPERLRTILRYPVAPR